MVIYHRSVTYHFYPKTSSVFLECKTMQEAKENVKKYGGEVYKLDRRLTDVGTINEFYRVIPAPPPMTIQGKTLEEWLGK